MNRINRLFQSQPRDLLSVYFCAGAPTLDGTADVIRALASRGIGMIEVGIPFSDPMADGPVIQAAATAALRNGMTLARLFDQLRDIRRPAADGAAAPAADIPLILMGYLNPIMHFGFERFCRMCREVGVDGMIIPDLPFRDYIADYKPIADRYDLRIVMLITPETSDDRIRLIDAHTDGFIYMVSSAATTGAQREFDEAKQAYFRRIDAMHLRNPRMIGFGISNRQTLDAALANADGAIVGSKFVSLLAEHPDRPDLAVDALLAALRS